MKHFEVLGNLVIPKGQLELRYRLFDYRDQNSRYMLWNYRDPYENEFIARISGTVRWHHDGDNFNSILILWSDMYPTEVKLPNGRIVAGKPNDVVIVRNGLVKHRVPAAYVRDVGVGIQKPRNFIRGWYENYPPDHVIEEWKKKLAKS